MSQTQEQKAVHPPIMRSEFIDRVGQNIGSFAALTRQRLQETATRVGAGLASAPTGPRRTAPQGEQPNQPAGKVVFGQGGIPQAEMQRAEGIVDNIGQRLGLLTSIVNLQLQKMAAYTREGAEDIVADAQHVRAMRKRVSR